MKLNNFKQCVNIYLASDNFSEDANFNGLQVQARAEVEKVAFAVSPTLSVIKQVTKSNYDTLVTHHGLYWKKQKCIATGVLGRRLSHLVESQINLLSYHLPLDCHNIVGNNAQIGKILQLSDVIPVKQVHPQGILYTGNYYGNKLDLFQLIKDLHPNSTNIYDFGTKDEALKVLWCSGAGGDFIELEQCDIFITGEISERHYNIAQELGISLVQAGHWATEVWGVKALSHWVENELNLPTIFINDFNPI